MKLLQADTLWALIEARADETPQAAFLADETDRGLTFSEYRDAAERAAAGLAGLGVGPGDTVAWQFPTWLESFVIMGALARLGARQMPLLPMYRESELRPLLARSEAKLWCLPSAWRKTDYEALAARVRKSNPGVRPLVCDRTLPEGDPGLLPSPPGPASGADAQWIFPTSGTTSTPKGVLHSDRSLMAGAANVCIMQGFRPEDRYGLAFPVTHIGGVSLMTAALRLGFALSVVESFDPAATAESFRRHGVTIAGGGPAFYLGFLEAQRRLPGEPILPDLRFMTGGGAPMPPEMHREVRDEIGGRGCAQGYGMTESCFVAMNHPDDTEEHLSNTVGKPTPYVEVRIVDDEIRIRGEAVCLGYLDATADESAWDDQGWFRTGDLGRLDADGYLRITGRAKEVIIRKGENISVTELEEVLYAHPDITDVAVIGLPDPVRGERVCAVVRTDGRKELTLADIAEHCAAVGLMRQKFPEQLELVDELPRGMTGKILKNELRARYSRAGRE